MTKAVLQRPLEPEQYLLIRYTERLAEAGTVASVGNRETPTTPSWRSRSTACTRQSLCTGADAGVDWTISKWRRLSGSTGSTGPGCTAPWATCSRPSTRRRATVQQSRRWPGLNKTGLHETRDGSRWDKDMRESPLGGNVNGTAPAVPDFRAKTD